MTEVSDVQKLLDRAEIQDLIHSYARCADTKRWEDFAQLYADDGYLVLPFGRLGKSDMAAAAGAVLKPFEATQHMFTNIVITLDEDQAQSNHYLQATHLPEAGAPSVHSDIGGWYDNTYRRTTDGWRIASVDLTFVWSGGIEFAPGDPSTR